VAKAAAKKQQQKPGLADKAAKLSKGLKMAIVAIFTVIVGLAFYGLFYMPYSEEKASLEGSIQSAQNSVNQEKSQLKKHNDVAAYTASVQVAREYIQKYLPQENEMSQLVQMVSTIASQAGLTNGVTQFAPKLPAVVQEDYAEIPFTMTLEGEFLTVLKFLYDFSRMTRIVNITAVDIGTPKMVDEKLEIMFITVKCSGSTYRALTDAEVEARSQASKSTGKGKGK